MSSSNRPPFQDITNGQRHDPKEVKRQRERERYAQKKDEILKRRRQLRELKRTSTAAIDDGDVQRNTTQIHGHGDVTLVGDDDSEWLPRNNEHEMQDNCIPAGSLTQITGAHDAMGCNNASTYNSQNSLGKQQRTSESWYSRLSDKDRADYREKQRIARQKKKAATSVGEVSQISGSSLPLSQHTPLSNMTNIQKNDVQNNQDYAPGHGDITLVVHNDDSEWLHRNDAYKMQENRVPSGSLTQKSGADDAVGCNNVPVWAPHKGLEGVLILTSTDPA